MDGEKCLGSLSNLKAFHIIESLTNEKKEKNQGEHEYLTWIL